MVHVSQYGLIDLLSAVQALALASGSYLIVMLYEVQAKSKLWQIAEDEPMNVEGEGAWYIRNIGHTWRSFLFSMCHHAMFLIIFWGSLLLLNVDNVLLWIEITLPLLPLLLLLGFATGGPEKALTRDELNLVAQEMRLHGILDELEARVIKAEHKNEAFAHSLEEIDDRAQDTEVLRTLFIKRMARRHDEVGREARSMLADEPRN